MSSCSLGLPYIVSSNYRNSTIQFSASISVGLSRGLHEEISAQTDIDLQVSTAYHRQDLGDKTASCSPTINFLHEIFSYLGQFPR